MNDVSLKNISSINGSFNNEPNVAASSSSNLRKKRSQSRDRAKTATFDLSNLSKAIAPVNTLTKTAHTNHHHHNQSTNLANSFVISQSTSSLAKTKHHNHHTHNNVDAKVPPFYPPGKTAKKSFIDSNSVYDFERATLYSTWTPLSDERANQKLFEERKQLFVKWFETWNDTQRRVAIEEMFLACKPKQLFYSRDVLNKIAPVYQIDFTRVLPRVISLYIMSFLDPRSLSRCAQVCWHWKQLSESDQLWMPKCLRFGWNLNYIPSSFETGIWKQFYIENIKSLQYVQLQKSAAVTERSEFNLKDLASGKYGFSNYMTKTRRNYKSSGPLKHPPWKGNSFNPNHLYRFNYLDSNANEEEMNAAKRADRLIKTLALDSSLKQSINHQQRQHQAQMIQQQQQQQVQTPTSANNLRSQSAKIDNLIKKGDALLTQMNLNKAEQTLNKTSELNTLSNRSASSKANNNQQQQQQMPTAASFLNNPNINTDIWKLLESNGTNDSTN